MLRLLARGGLMCRVEEEEEEESGEARGWRHEVRKVPSRSV